MDVPGSRTGRPAQRQDADRPAVGIVVREGDEDAMARVLLRASDRGQHVLCAFSAEAPVGTVELARGFDGATVVGSDDRPLRQRLSVAAQERGYPGVLYHDAVGDRIDFDRSLSRWEATDSYTVETVVSADRRQRADTVVAIPAYNEAGTIGGVVDAARAYAGTVLVVDDGSTDATVREAIEAGATVIEHGENRGYGAALKTAFAEAATREAGQLVIIDGDGQHDPADIPELLDRLEAGDADLVIGSRFSGHSTDGVPTYRRAGLAVINALTNVSLGSIRNRVRVSDAQSGYRAYGRRMIQSLAADDRIGDGMGASTDILFHAHRNGYDIAEVGVRIEYEVDNASSHHPVEHGLHLINNLLQTVERDHPILLFGVPGTLSVLGGTALAYWSVVNFMQTATFPIGLALTAAFFLFAGILSAFTGIILHALNQLPR